jgi:hypothetical protein
MKIYLDINSTIIYRTLNKGKVQVTHAKYLKEFLENALAKHQVFWLSTMCQGNLDDVLYYLKPFLPKDILELALKVKPTSWNNHKVEAINLKDDFLWFDDVLMQKEEEILKKAGKLDSFVRVNHYKNDKIFSRYVNI